MTTRPAAPPFTEREEAMCRKWGGDLPPGDVLRMWATLDREREDRRRLADELLRIHYPPQIGTHYEQGFADCLRAVLAEFERL